MSAVFFYNIMVNSLKLFALAVALLAVTVVGQTYPFYGQPQYLPNAYVYQSPQSAKNGLTFQATIQPSSSNNWAGRYSCNNCNPTSGDTPCNTSLPLLCIHQAKTLTRPYYAIQNTYVSGSNSDGGYYDGWTGGLL
jgi:hypothetical protein